MNRLKELRQHKKISQKELAAVVNVKQNTISNWESGNTEIDQKNLIALSDYFDVSVDYILGRDYVNKIASVSDDENELLKYYRKLNEKNKSVLFDVAKGIAEKD